jgi:hypothetical protein
VLLGILWLLPCVAVADDPAVDGLPSPQQVDRAIDKGAAFLLERIDHDPRHSAYKGEELVALALLHAGKRSDRRFGKLLERILARPLSRSGDYPVYNVALRMMVLQELNAEHYLQQIAECAWWLVNAQTDNGQWGYYGPDQEPPKEFGRRIEWAITGNQRRKKVQRWIVERTAPWTTKTPLSPAIYRNTSTAQYALLGLWAAHKAGISIPAETWRRAKELILRTQLVDGAWGYIPMTGRMPGNQPAMARTA